MMSAVETLVLGAVQGITEFLPVSSSGHLALARFLLRVRFENPLAFDTAVHLGTVLSILAVFGRRIFPSAREVKGIAVAFVFTVPVALMLEGVAKSVSGAPHLLASSFFAGGLVLLLSKVRTRTNLPEPLRWVLVGIAQGIAVIPGISRSGTTISFAIASGMSREEAFSFSFKLAVPTIISATVWTARDFRFDIPPELVALAVAVSFVTGAIALKVLERAVVGGKLHLFSFWLFFAGGISFLLS